MAQNSTVNGRVTDEKGDPIVGASIQVKGTKVGTTSNNDGVFTIKAANGASLTVQAIGFETKTVAAAANLNVKLVTDVRALSEVVVTGFGGSLIKKELTGNIARVKGKDIEFMPTASVDAALQGRAAGVFVNSQSGKLGQAVTVRIRGNSSISASSQPLYVLDGIPITSQDQSTYGGDMNPLTDLNPNDIESIDVLKDASAGAIYGSRAANGVVLITTKRGRAGKTQITFNLQSGQSEATKRVRMLNSTEYNELALEAAKYSDDQEDIPYDDPYSYTQYMKDIMSYHSYGQWDKDKAKSYDWQDQAFQTGQYRQADLQIRGGNDKTKFFSSFQHLDQGGTIRSNELSRTTGRLNVDQKANDWLDLGVSLSLSRIYNRRLPGDNAFSNPLQAAALLPMSPFTDPNTGLPTGTPPGDVNVGIYFNPQIQIDYA